MKRRVASVMRWVLGFETDRMVNVKFTKPILDTEMTVVGNEFERVDFKSVGAYR